VSKQIEEACKVTQHSNQHGFSVFCRDLL